MMSVECCMKRGLLGVILIVSLMENPGVVLGDSIDAQRTSSEDSRDPEHLGVLAEVGTGTGKGAVGAGVGFAYYISEALSVAQIVNVGQFCRAAGGGFESRLVYGRKWAVFFSYATGYLVHSDAFDDKNTDCSAQQDEVTRSQYSSTVSVGPQFRWRGLQATIGATVGPRDIGGLVWRGLPVFALGYELR